MLGALVLQPRHAADEGRSSEDQVDVHAPAPRQVLGQHPAEQQSDGRAAAGDRAVDAEGLGPFPGVGERGGQQRERGGGQHGTECSLHSAGGDQHAEPVCRTTHGRREGEPDQSDQEHPFAPQQVCESPTEQQQASEGQ
nr:hypothetical protein [Nakamurella sp. PAMC28650]